MSSFFAVRAGTQAAANEHNGVLTPPDPTLIAKLVMLGARGVHSYILQDCISKDSNVFRGG